MPRVGLISDTHGFLDPAVATHFAGVDHIIHGGDIGWPRIILELEQIAPVTAVLGNVDTGLHFRETELITIERRRILVHHIVNPRKLSDPVQRRLARERPDIVVFGHTHEPFCEVVDGVLFVNPGSAGKSRFGKPRTLAVLHWVAGDGDLQVDFTELGP